MWLSPAEGEAAPPLLPSPRDGRTTRPARQRTLRVQPHVARSSATCAQQSEPSARREAQNARRCCVPLPLRLGANAGATDIKRTPSSKQPGRWPRTERHSPAQAKTVRTVYVQTAHGSAVALRSQQGLSRFDGEHYRRNSVRYSCHHTEPPEPVNTSSSSAAVPATLYPQRCPGSPLSSGFAPCVFHSACRRCVAARARSRRV